MKEHQGRHFISKCLYKNIDRNKKFVTSDLLHVVRRGVATTSITASLIATVMPAQAAIINLGGNIGGTGIVDKLRGLTTDGTTIRVYGDDDVHRYDTDFNFISRDRVISNMDDAMSYDSSHDGVTSGGIGFDQADHSTGVTSNGRGFQGVQQTRALHGHVNVAGVDYTLATTNDSDGNLTTGWYNTTNTGLGQLVQVVDLTNLMGELGITQASDVTGGTMYLALDGDENNLSHYIPLLNTATHIGQVDPITGDTQGFVLGAVDNIQDIAISGNTLYAIDAVDPSGIGTLNQYDFGNNHYSVAVPSPSSSALLSVGLLSFVSYRRRKEFWNL